MSLRAFTAKSWNLVLSLAARVRREAASFWRQFKRRSFDFTLLVIAYTLGSLIALLIFSNFARADVGTQAGFVGGEGAAYAAPDPYADFAPALKTSCSAVASREARKSGPPCGGRLSPHKETETMAQGKFEDAEKVITLDGEVREGLKGMISTRQEDLVLEIYPDSEGPFFQGAGDNVPTHTVQVLARTGKFIYSGRGWTKRGKSGEYVSVSLEDPRLNFSVWPLEDTPGHWGVRVGAS